jgi:hypothetical protein
MACASPSMAWFCVWLYQYKCGYPPPKNTHTFVSLDTHHPPGSCFCKSWMACASPSAAAARASFASAALLVLPVEGPSLLSCRYSDIASEA